MKKLGLGALALALCGLPSIASAQVTLHSTNVPAVGDYLTEAAGTVGTGIAVALGVAFAFIAIRAVYTWSKSMVKAK